MATTRSWRPALFALLVLVGIAAAWTAYWYLSRELIAGEIARQEALLQERGGALDCAERAWYGFPLRVSLSCRRTAFAAPEGPVVKGAGLEVSAPLYTPGRVVIVARPPTKLRGVAEGTIAIDHSPVTVALNLRPGTEPTGTAEIDSFTVEAANGWSFKGRNLFIEGMGPAPDQLAFAATAGDVTLAYGTATLMGLNGLALRGRIEGLPDVPPIDPKAWLREAVRQGSRVTIESFEARLASVVITAAGAVTLAPSGPTGTLTTSVSNLAAFLSDLEQRGLINRQAAQAVMLVIGLLQGNRNDGSVTVDLRLHEGRVFWGPFAIAEIPPLR